MFYYRGHLSLVDVAGSGHLGYTPGFLYTTTLPSMLLVSIYTSNMY